MESPEGRTRPPGRRLPHPRVEGSRPRQILKEIKEKTFLAKYWDGNRIFGNTFLEEGQESLIKSGVVQFGLGLSVCDYHRSKNDHQQGRRRGGQGPRHVATGLPHRAAWHLLHAVLCQPHRCGEVRVYARRHQPDASASPPVPIRTPPPTCGLRSKCGTAGTSSTRIPSASVPTSPC